MENQRVHHPVYGRGIVVAERLSEALVSFRNVDLTRTSRWVTSSDLKEVR